jgi:hypothetical protein
MKTIDHLQLDNTIKLAKDFSTDRLKLVVYRPPDDPDYYIGIKGSQDYHQEWVVWEE